MISFIVPAHNEEHFLGAALAAIQDSANSLQRPHELIVAADACTDATESVAERHGAHVVRVSHRHIAATRNAGARAATGDVLFFIDADTLANPQAVRACLDAVEKGSIGGGCMFRFDCPLPLWGHVMYHPSILIGRWIKLVGGCFLFCTRDAFERVGGFDESVYAAEELVFLNALKRIGRVSVPRPTIVTSGRKLALVSPREILRLMGRIAFRGPRTFRTRDGLDLFYGRRCDVSRQPAPLPTRDSPP